MNKSEFDIYYLGFKTKYKDYFLFASEDEVNVVCRPDEWFHDKNREWRLLNYKKDEVQWNTNYVKLFNTKHRLTFEEVDDIWNLLKAYLKYLKEKENG